MSDENKAEFTTAPAQSELEQQFAKDRIILEELLEDAEQKMRIMLKFQAAVEILQASDKLKKEKIKLWADRLEVSTKTVERLVEAFDEYGVAALAKDRRSDAGVVKGSEHWKGKTIEEWIEFIKTTYKEGNENSRRMNRNQVFGQVKGIAKRLGLTSGEYPSRGFVYAILEPLVGGKKKKRNSGQGPGIVIKVTDGENVEEILVEHSNQVWQIDHTRLDNLLTDANGFTAGTVWITAVIDTYSGCWMGFHMGFEAPGSHQVALALRHAISQKHYGPEYKLIHQPEVCGTPEYVVTDHAKEFKKALHLKRIALDLGFKMRFRREKEQGGVVERLFLELKNEIASLLPGYKGGSLTERPEDAEKNICIFFEEYERLLVRHLVDHRNQHHYPRARNQTRLQRWWAGLIGGEPVMPLSEVDLSICLMKEEKRKVQKYGTIEFKRLIYGAGWKRDEDGNWKYNAEENFLGSYTEVTLRYNPSNIVYLLVYTREKDGQPSKYLGTIRIRNAKEEGLYHDEERLSLKEWEYRLKRRNAEADAIEQDSVFEAQLDLVEFSNEKVRQHRKRGKHKNKDIRREEQERITRASDHSNVVQPAVVTDEAATNVVAFPSNNSPAEDKASTKKVEQHVELPPSDALESTHKVEPQVKPALYVVSNWDEFVDDGW